MYLPSPQPIQNQSSPMENNTHVFTVLIDLCYDATRASQTSLLIRPSNPRKQNLLALTHFFPRLWGLDNMVNGRVADHGRAQFMFPSNESQLVLRQGPWSFNDWMVAMVPWTPIISDQSPTSIEFWVQIQNVPLQFLSTEMIRYIAESLGDVVETDDSGFGGTTYSGRVCIRWPLDRPLVFERMFQFGHESATITFRFERLSNYYFRCHSLQHGIEECDVHEADAASGHQDPEGDDGNIQHIFQMHQQLPPSMAPIQETSISTLPS